MKKAATPLAAALALVVSASAQVLVTTSGNPITIDFDSTVAGATNGQFDGSGFDTSPAAGQLDSDAWALTGMSDGDLDFGGTATTASDFARGTVTGSVSTGGLYAFGTTDRQLLIQPGGTDWTPGTLELRVQNGMGTGSSSFTISYDVFVNNDQDRGSSLDFSYSLDGGTTFLTEGLSDPFFNYTSPEIAGTDGWTLAGTASASVVLSSALGDEDPIIFKWTGDDSIGSGTRDEYGLDNISIGMTAIPEPSTYATIMGLVTFVVVMIRRNRKAQV